jgi:hypothetical protein
LRCSEGAVSLARNRRMTAEVRRRSSSLRLRGKLGAFSRTASRAVSKRSSKPGSAQQ